ncbi:MAG: citrate/2-methylcitrate synthase [Candidatus Kapaibacterium sp.]
MGKKRFITAKEAAKELNVSLTTLYAYVSRGLVRSEATAEKNDKRKRYAYEDIERLKSRKELRREPNKAAERALHWGTPILQSSITMIAENQLYYRGRNAVELSESSTVEEVALLLWEAEGLSEETFPTKTTDLPKEWSKLKGTVGNLPFIQQFLILLLIAETEDPTAYDLTPQRVRKTGSRIVRMMASVVANRDVGREGIARTLAKTWGGNKRGSEALINAALILCADHELNISSFTARCVASAGSNPYAAIMAGLSALKGTKHGGETAKVEAFLREVGKPSEIRRTIAERLSRGEEIPGFGHTLYPDGDPRGRALLDLTYKHYPRSATTKLIQGVEAEMREGSEQEPTIDLALTAIARNLALPPDGAITLFALGRAVGWIAHAQEQYKLNSIIRPRARYVGKTPEGKSENQSMLE